MGVKPTYGQPHLCDPNILTWMDGGMAGFMDHLPQTPGQDANFQLLISIGNHIVRVFVLWGW